MERGLFEANSISACARSFDRYRKWLVQKVESTTIDSKEDVCVSFSKAKLSGPLDDEHVSVTPVECMQRNISYEGELSAEVRVRRGDQMESRRILIARMPLMVPRGNGIIGGHFVVNGKCKFFLTQEVIARNVCIVIQRGGTERYARVVSSNGSPRPSPMTVTLGGGCCMRDFAVSFGSKSKKVSAVDLLEFLGYPPWMAARKLSSMGVGGGYSDATSLAGRSGTALQRIAVSLEIDSKEVAGYIDERMLPHVRPSIVGGLDGVRRAKAFTLCGCMAKLALSFATGVDDMDNFKYKSFMMAGDLMRELASEGIRKTVNSVRYSIDKCPECNVFGLIESCGVLTKLVRKHMINGVWHDGKVGVSQNFDMYNYPKILSDLTKVMKQSNRKSKNVSVRTIHRSSFGYTCLAETVEGQRIGLVKNFCAYASVSGESPAGEMKSVASRLLGAGSGRAKSMLFLNGCPAGECRGTPAELVREFVKARSENSEMTIELDDQIPATYVWSESSRVIRPVIFEGKKIWVSPGMEEAMGVVGVEYEEYPGHSVGLVASLIPYWNHNHSPKNTCGTVYIKQAYGLHGPWSSNAKVQDHLYYAEPPLVRTRMSEAVGMPRYPYGQNVLVAIVSHPYNQEDAIVMNKDSVERGLFFGFSERMESARCTGAQRFGVPDARMCAGPRNRGWPREWHSGFDGDGMPVDGSPVAQGRALFGITNDQLSRDEIASGGKYRDDSVLFDRPNLHTVSRVERSYVREGEEVARVYMTRSRFPKQGDKYSSRHGQKGVIGALIPGVDMPRTRDGLVPDVLLNPHCMPKRMTVGQMLEMVAGKIACQRMRPSDGTPKLRDESILGFKGDVLYSGLTGRRIPGTSFIGVAYYMKLRQVVDDIFQFRRGGCRDKLTRQPVHGSRFGHGSAQRVGQMEVESLVSHGASHVIFEKLQVMSDLSSVKFCASCGFLASGSEKGSGVGCKACGSRGRTVSVSMPYSCKLAIQEMTQCGASMQVIVKGESE